MPAYRAPVDDTLFVLNDVLKYERYSNLPGFADASPKMLVQQSLAEGLEVIVGASQLLHHFAQRARVLSGALATVEQQQDLRREPLHPRGEDDLSFRQRVPVDGVAVGDGAHDRHCPRGPERAPPVAERRDRRRRASVP